MASPTQIVVGEGKPNPLLAEGLLKILRDPILPITIQHLQRLRIEEYISFYSLVKNSW